MIKQFLFDWSMDAFVNEFSSTKFYYALEFTKASLRLGASR